MRVLSLFSGIGLHDLGLERAGFEIAAQVELDPWCVEVLKKHWPEVPKFDDVRTVSADALRLAGVGRIDLITGGFPCQPHSVAGRRKGVDDERHLWPEYARIIREVGPSWVLAENVPGLRTTAADLVLGDLDAAGYTAWPLVVGADDVGAPHRRKRVWIVANRDGAGLHRLGCSGLLDGERTARGHDADGRCERAVGESDSARRQEADCRCSLDAGSEPVTGCCAVGDACGSGLAILSGESGDARQKLAPALGASRSGDVSNPEGERRTEQGHGRDAGPRAGCDGARWPARPGEAQHAWEAPRLTKPGLGGATDGRARRLDGFARRNRLKALGNGNPPQVVEAIGKVIMEYNQPEAA